MLCIVCLDSLMIILGHHYVTILLAKTLNWTPFSQSMCNFYFCINRRSILIFLMRDIHINFNLNPLAKFTSNSRITKFKNIPSMKYLSNDHEDHSKQLQKSHIIYEIKQVPFLSLMERQWKLRQQHDQNFSMEGKPLQNKYQRQMKEINPKEQVCGSHNRGPIDG